MQVKNCRLESFGLFYYRGFLRYKDWFNRKSKKLCLTNYPEANNWEVRIATEIYFQLILNLSDWQNVSPMSLAFKMVCEMNVLVFFGEDFGKHFIFFSTIHNDAESIKQATLNMQKRYSATCEM